MPGIFSVWDCLFLQGLFQHLVYFLVLTYHPCPIWAFTWGLWSVLEGHFLSQCLQRFRRGFQSGQKIFPIVTAQAGLIIFFLLIHRSSWQSPLLSPGFSLSMLSYVGFLRDLSCAKRFPVFLGIQNYWTDCSTSMSNVMVIIIPALLFLHSVIN